VVKDNIKGSSHLCKKHVGIATPSSPESVIDEVRVITKAKRSIFYFASEIANNLYPKPWPFADTMLEDELRLFLHGRIKF
jgi:hypothetical protein